MIRRQEQEFAALALVAAGRADAHDLALPQVRDAAEESSWRFDHNWAIAFQVDRAEAVDRLAVASEQERGPVHQVFPQDDLIRRSRSGVRNAFPDPIP